MAGGLGAEPPDAVEFIHSQTAFVAMFMCFITQFIRLLRQGIYAGNKHSSVWLPWLEHLELHVYSRETNSLTYKTNKINYKQTQRVLCFIDFWCSFNWWLHDAYFWIGVSHTNVRGICRNTICMHKKLDELPCLFLFMIIAELQNILCSVWL